MNGNVLFTFGCAAVISGLALCTGTLHGADSTAVDKPAVSLLAVGDWGIDAPQRQQVGDAMAAYASHESQPQTAALLLGDNFYVKLKNLDDPQIQTFFEKTYDPAKLNFPFYMVAGNHDYRDSNLRIEMEYAKRPQTRMKMPSRWYRLDLPAGKPLVTIFMLDSDAPPGLMTDADWKAENQWLKNELGKPHATWLMACAHHDIFGNGSHGDNGVLMTTWGKLFKQAKVDLYLCGHEHTLQHLEIPDWPISFVIAGGGGAGTKPMLRDQRGPFSRSVTGFAALQFTPGKMDVKLITADGKVVHEFNRDREGHIDVTLNTPSDKATTHPARVIQGIDDKGKTSKDD